MCDYLKQNTSIVNFAISDCDLSEILAALGNMLAANSHLDIFKTVFTINDFIDFIELIESLEQLRVKQEFCNHPEVNTCIQNLNHSRNFILELIAY